MRLLQYVALLALLAGALGAAQAQQNPTVEEVQELIRERAAAHGANAQQLLAVVDCETGGTYRLDLIGRTGERGAAQWHPARSAAWRLTSYAAQGLWIVDLYRAGDPRAPYLDIDGLAEVFARYPDAARREWSCWYG